MILSPHRLAVALVAGALVALVNPMAPAADGGFRCESGRLVGVGDHMFEVQKKCGDPDFAGQRTEKRKVKAKVRAGQRHGDYSEELTEEREVEILLDEWIYDLGPTRFIRNVLFENGRVIDVSTGGYGRNRRS
jgi:hypothetical protein